METPTPSWFARFCRILASFGMGLEGLAGE